MSRSLTIVFLAAAVTLVACGGGFDLEERQARARFEHALARWEQAAIPSYEFLYRRQAFILPEWQRWFRVRVENGEITDIRDAETGDPPPTGFTAPTIAELFELVDDALSSADALLVEYDFDLGYPTLVSVDYSFQIADEEFVIIAQGLVSLP